MAKRSKDEKADIKIRLTEGLRSRIENAAASRGVSMNSEMIERLERSFEWERATMTAKQWLADARKVVDGQLEAALRQAGYTPITGIPGGRYWASPDTDLSKINMGINVTQVVNDIQPDLVRALALALGKFAKKDGSNVD